MSSFLEMLVCSSDLALLVQPGLAGLPGEHVHVERPEDAGGGHLVVLDVTRLQPHGL